MWCLAVSTGLGELHAAEEVGWPSVLVGAAEVGRGTAVIVES